jgi:thioredoxin reductase
MYLRSMPPATSIGYRWDEFSLERYEHAIGGSFGWPIPLDAFIAYGHWFQEAAIPDVEPRAVKALQRAGTTFSIQLDDEEHVKASSVVVAAGIAAFAWRPPLFDGLPAEVATHSSEHDDFEPFRGKRVLIVGGGQSALESAALLHEVRAEVEVVVKAPALRYLRGERLYERGGRFKRVLYPPLGVGPPGLNRLMGSPSLFRLLPSSTAAPLAYRVIRPAGASWLRPRLDGVTLTVDREISAVAETHGRVTARLSDGTSRTFDHVILGTGYRVDVAKYDFLTDDVVAHLKRINGCPMLDRAFESSLPGLYFVGAPAAASAGPGMRFVSHSGIAAHAITRRMTASTRGTSS